MSSPADNPFPWTARAALRHRFGPDCEQAREPFVGPGALPGHGAAGLVYDPYNHRLKLLGVRAAELGRPEVARWVEGLRGDDPPYSKLLVYGRPGDEPAWERHGYRREGRILGYFADGGEAWIHSRFATPERQRSPREAAQAEIVEQARRRPARERALPSRFRTRRATVADADELAAVLGEVFPDYPTPLDAATLAGRIGDGSNVFRVVVDRGGRFAACASAEVDRARRSAELTDCATLPGHRGAGLMGVLLHELEREAIEGLGANGLYTIARADEVGMNVAFARLGWVFTGRLRNNCRMPSGWESMNLWCRPGGAHGVLGSATAGAAG